MNRTPFSFTINACSALNIKAATNIVIRSGIATIRVKIPRESRIEQKISAKTASIKPVSELNPISSGKSVLISEKFFSFGQPCREIINPEVPILNMKRPILFSP